MKDTDDLSVAADHDTEPRSPPRSFGALALLLALWLLLSISNQWFELRDHLRGWAIVPCGVSDPASGTRVSPRVVIPRLVG